MARPRNSAIYRRANLAHVMLRRTGMDWLALTGAAVLAAAAGSGIAIFERFQSRFEARSRSKRQNSNQQSR